MTDLIPLDAAIAALEKWVQVSQSTWQSPMTVIRAIPAIDPAAIREAALIEAADHFASLAVLRRMWSAAEVEKAILALIGEKK